MRNAIREQLILNMPGSFTDVYEPHMAEHNTPKPYAVVRQGADMDDDEWMGFRRIVEVWPYVSRSTFTKVDQLADQVVASLDRKILTDTDTGEVFSCVYLGTAGADVVDTEFDAITRGLRFAVMALKPVSTPETVASDPWIDALAVWTSDLLGAGWNVYKNILPLGYDRPSVLWRLRSVRAIGVSRGLSEIRKVIVGHVLGDTPNQQTAGVISIVHGAIEAIKIPLNATEKTFMTVDGQPEGNIEVDGLTTGQITLTLCRKTSRPQIEYPIMAMAEGSRFNP